MLQIKFDYDWPTGCWDIWVWKCLRTDGRTNGRTDGRRIDRYTISSPWAFGSGELKIAETHWADNRLPPVYQMECTIWGKCRPTSSNSHFVYFQFVYTHFVNLCFHKLCENIFLIQIVYFFCLEMYKIANTVEKLRKICPGIYFNHFVKINNSRRNGNRRVGKSREELSFHGIFCNIYLGVGVPMLACFRVCYLFQVNGVRNMEDYWRKVVWKSLRKHFQPMWLSCRRHIRAERNMVFIFSF